MRLAGDVLDPDAIDRGRDQTAPERMVDLRHRGVCDDEWAERAGRRDDLGSSILEVLEPGLEPDGAECAAEPFEPPARVLRRLDSRGGGQRAAELHTDLRQTPRRHGVDQQADELRVAAHRELDRGRVGRGGVDLGRSARARPAAAGRPLEARRQQPRRDEALEPASRDVPVDAGGIGDLADARRTRPPAHGEQGLAQLRVTYDVEHVHSCSNL